MARSITDPGLQARALAKSAAALAQAGSTNRPGHRRAGRGRSLLDHEPKLAGERPGRVAGALAQAGQQQAAAIAAQAETVVRSVTRPAYQWGAPAETDALPEVAGALARAGRHQQAIILAGSVTDPAVQAAALTEVARGLAEARQHQQAAAIAAQAETAARSIPNGSSKASALAQAAEALARRAAPAGGRHRRAGRNRSPGAAGARVRRGPALDAGPDQDADRQAVPRRLHRRGHLEADAPARLVLLGPGPPGDGTRR